MSVTIDFKKLSLQDALDLAILIEREAQERYEEFAKLIGARYSGDASDFFEEMSRNENKHATELSSRRKELFGQTPSRVDGSMIWDVEAPSQSSPRTYMSVRQALELAEEAEEKAFRFFDGALKYVANAEVKTLFEELRGEEAQHKKMVRDRLAKLPPGDGPDIPDGEGDEPPQL